MFNFFSNKITQIVILVVIGILAIFIIKAIANPKNKDFRKLVGTISLMVLFFGLIGSAYFSVLKINKYYNTKGGIKGALNEIFKQNEVTVDTKELSFNFKNISLIQNDDNSYSAEFITNDVITLNADENYALYINETPVLITSYGNDFFTADYKYVFYGRDKKEILSDTLKIEILTYKNQTNVNISTDYAKTHEQADSIELWNSYFNKNGFILEIKVEDDLYAEDSIMSDILASVQKVTYAIDNNVIGREYVTKGNCLRGIKFNTIDEVYIFEGWSLNGNDLINLTNYPVYEDLVLTPIVSFDENINIIDKLNESEYLISSKYADNVPVKGIQKLDLYKTTLTTILSSDNGSFGNIYSFNDKNALITSLYDGSYYYSRQNMNFTKVSEDWITFNEIVELDSGNIALINKQQDWNVFDVHNLTFNKILEYNNHEINYQLIKEDRLLVRYWKQVNNSNFINNVYDIGYGECFGYLDKEQEKVIEIYTPTNGYALFDKVLKQYENGDILFTNFAGFFGTPEGNSAECYGFLYYDFENNTMTKLFKGSNWSAVYELEDNRLLICGGVDPTNQTSLGVVIFDPGTKTITQIYSGTEQVNHFEVSENGLYIKNKDVELDSILYFDFDTETITKLNKGESI